MTTMTANNSLLQDADYQPLKRYVIESTGLWYYIDRDETLAARIGQRFTKIGSSGCRDYLELLHEGQRGEEELDHLIQDLTIGETYFFRHPELFNALRDVVLPEIIRRNGESRRLRIWSAGSSIGAEAYSLSILLRRDLAHLVSGWDISILGTDINREFLARAGQAQYEAWALRGLSAALQEECFVRQEKSWKLRRKYREGVSFQYHNLVKHPFPSLVNNLFAFDLILCRNVLIYFNHETIDRVVGQMRKCLVPEGWFIVGHAEYNQRMFRDFETNSQQGVVLYRCPPSEAGDCLSEAAPAAPPTFSPPARINIEAPMPFKAERAKRPANQPPRIVAVPPQHQPAAAEDTTGGKLTKIRQLADGGRLEDALELCESLCKAHPLVPNYHFCLALLLDQKGEHAHADTSLSRTIYLDRKHVLAHYYRGLVLQKRGLSEDAAKSFQNTLRLTANLPEGQVILESDGMTVADVSELAEMQLRTIQQI